MIIRKFQCRSNQRSDEVKRGRMVSLSYKILQQVPPHPTLVLLKPPPILIFKLVRSLGNTSVTKYNAFSLS